MMIIKVTCVLFGLWCAPACDPGWYWVHASNGQNMCWPGEKEIEKMSVRCAMADKRKIPYTAKDLCGNDPNLLLK